MAAHLYVHVPFCVRKCGYCSFYSEEGAGEDALRAFVRLAPEEARVRGATRDARPETVYLGGGTPSRLGPDGLSRLLAALPRPSDGGETTVECNPGDVAPAFARALRAAGVTRASLGAQSLCDGTLRFLGRRHGAADVRAAVAALRSAGVPRLSLDLIAAVPGEPAGAFEASVREAVALGAGHVSVYPLSLEPDAPLARAGVRPPDGEAAADAVAGADAILSAEGFVRYELSNWARPGEECRHNLAVWRGADYTGIGPGAHSREGLLRRIDEPSFAAWRSALEAGRDAPARTWAATPEEDADERFLTTIRLAAFAVPDPASDKGRRRLASLAALAREGIARALPGGRWSLTPRGREVADAVMEELL